MTHPIAGKKWCNKIPGNYDATIVAVVGDHVWYKLTECAHFVSTIAAFMKDFTPPPEDHGIEVGQRYRSKVTNRFVTITGVLTDGTIMAEDNYLNVCGVERLPAEYFKARYRPVIRRPRTVDDVKKMLAKVESPTLWVQYPNEAWLTSQGGLDGLRVSLWNAIKARVSLNPFVDNPFILESEVEE